MIIFKQIAPLVKKLHQLKNEGKSIGFVPTMGALHNGHLSLIDHSRTVADVTVCSIFVNPAQFNDKADFDRYPATPEQDILLLEKEKTDIVFLPGVHEIYPNGFISNLSWSPNHLENILEGYYRPGHFRGVCMVMHRLLSIVEPDELFMGQKDYQQCMVVKSLIDHFFLPVHINIVATQRETSGLAMSSRNMRLSATAKLNASGIYRALLFIKENISDLPFEELKHHAQEIITNAGFQKTDYVAICDAATLLPVTENSPSVKKVALAAAFLDGVRLIDNMLI